MKIETLLALLFAAALSLPQAGCKTPALPSLRESLLGPRCAAERALDLGAGHFVLRERVWVDRGDGSSDLLDLVIEGQSGRLVLVGLSPIGAKLFSVVQTTGETADEVEVDGLPVALLPAHPLDVLEAVHAARLGPRRAGYSLASCSAVDAAEDPHAGPLLRFERIEETRD